MLNLERLCLAFMVFFSRVKIVKRFTAEKKLVRQCIGDMSGLLSGMINGDMKREYKLPLTTISEETNRERESALPGCRIAWHSRFAVSKTVRK